jgi:hypothetical protein
MLKPDHGQPLISDYLFVVRFLKKQNFLDTGRRSNRWIRLFILIGSGNLYAALNDSVVETCIDPNKLPEMTSEHNLELSFTSDHSFFVSGRLESCTLDLVHSNGKRILSKSAPGISAKHSPRIPELI